MGRVTCGSALAVYGVTRRSVMGYSVAGAGRVLAYLGATSDRTPREFVAETNILLNISPQDAYRFWHDFENLPRFMRHLASVKTSGNRRSHWVAYGPLGARIEWETEIIDERENEFIQPPAGAIGHAFAKFVGRDPHFMIRNDVRRFKA